MMEVVEFGPLTDELRAQLEGDEDDPFDAAGIELQFRRKERHVALRAPDGALVASTGLLVVEVEVESARFPAGATNEPTRSPARAESEPTRFPVVGVGGVIVNRRWRGRGLARQVVEAALATAQTLGPDFALLFCHDDRAGLYVRLGFADVPGVVRVDQPGGYRAMPQRAMWRALSPGVRWPEGELIVHSLPF
jgi:predicted GNAT family N-acyltransferase